MSGFSIQVQNRDGAWKDVGYNNPIPTHITGSYSGDLVRVPFRNGYQSISTSGTGATISWQDAGILTNEDGTGTAAFFNVPKTVQGSAKLSFVFYGGSLGLRFLRDANTPDFTCMVDGEAFDVMGAHQFFVQNGVTITDGEVVAMIGRKFNSDKPHYVEVMVHSSPDVNRTLTLFGFVAERAAGYEDVPRLSHIINPGTAVPVSYATISRGTAPNTLRGIRRVIYTNTSGSPATVTVAYNSTTAYWQETIEAGKSAVIDFGNPTVGTNSTFTHKASATGVVFTVVGGY